MIGRSPAIMKVRELIETVSDSDATVMITGESGTGKELVAEEIHRRSRRASRPFVPVNCGALSPQLVESELFGHERGSFTGAVGRRKGCFEQADGGTLFLDEITEMPLEQQVKLLRVLEDGSYLRVGGEREVTVDVRVIAASNRDLREALEKKQLREDLYYRLRVFPIGLPPLQARGREEIELLAQHFLDQLVESYDEPRRWSRRALAALAEYPWPGNVRELKNVVQRAFILAEDTIKLEHLPSEVRHPGLVRDHSPFLRIEVGARLEDLERRLILWTLERNDWRRQETAQTLGISPKTLYNRLRSYGVQ